MHTTRSKFRLPNRPSSQADGLHWQRLYKRLLTQSRVYTWGQNVNGCLGHGVEEVDGQRIQRRGMPPRIPRPHYRAIDQAWPEEMIQARDLGVIADLQCGGWSTTMLNDKGVLFTVGVLNGISNWDTKSEVTQMKFPSTVENNAARVAVRQFSSGRTHMLGLSDDDTIWNWKQVQSPGTPVSLSNLSSSSRKVRSVVAGWNKSSAFLPGTGIVLWDIITTSGDGSSPTLVEDWVIVPRSGYKRPIGKQRELDEATRLIGEHVGEVTNYIVLEHFVVFVTDLKKIFAARIHWSRDSGVIHDSFELEELQSTSQEDTTPCVTDVNGSFRTFAVLKNNGTVQIADHDYLVACARAAFDNDISPRPALTAIPALQHTGVVQVAFGDYHYHALHSDGSISSYGREPGGCGALGLGSAIDMGVPPGVLRGVKYNTWNNDGNLLPHAYFRGRRIHFQPEHEKWIRFLAAGGKDHDESEERRRMVNSVPPAQGEVSEWIEQIGSGWEKRPKVQEKNEDGLGAYFALSVAAAGWHSGALVLVNDQLVHAVSDSCLIDSSEVVESSNSKEAARASAPSSAPLEASAGPGHEGSFSSGTNPAIPGAFPEDENLGEQPEPAFDLEATSDSTPSTKGKRYIWHDQDFPRLELDHGIEMPGTIEFSRWKEEKPDWKLRWGGQGSGGKVFGVEGWERVE